MSDAKDRLRLWLRLLKVTRQVEGDLRNRFRSEFATTLPRFDVMAALSRAPEGLRMSALSAVLRVSNGNVTGIVDRLVEDGIVERISVTGDRRAMIVRLTAAGRVAFDQQALAHEAWVDMALSGLSAEDVRQVSERLAGALADKEPAHAH